MGAVYLGIDPGNSGALAAISEAQVRIWDAPVQKISRGLGKSSFFLSEDAMVDIVREAIVGYTPKAAIEWAQAMPQQGVSSCFNYGTGFGMWRGVLAALNVPRIKVRPREWMKEIFKGHGHHDKDASIMIARELFPTAELTLKKHHGRAEALLIAEYLRRMA